MKSNVQNSSSDRTRMSAANGNHHDPVKQPAEHQLDDDAKLRMDDEGGSVAPHVIVPDQIRKFPDKPTV